MVSYALVTTHDIEYQEPQNYMEAITSKDTDKWLIAMTEEIQSLEKNYTWDLVNKPKDQKIVKCKWIFKKKIEVTSTEQVKFKARLVARGFTQREEIDFNEVFSPVVKLCSTGILLSKVNQDNLELQQLDVKITFLHGDLVETIYMQQPEGFTTPGNEYKVCLLKKKKPTLWIKAKS